MNTTINCEQVFELLTSTANGHHDLDIQAHLADCENCRAQCGEILPAVEWIHSLSDLNVGSSINRVSSEARVADIMHSVRFAADQPRGQQSTADEELAGISRRERPSTLQKTMVALLAIAGALLLSLVLLPGKGQAAKSPETYLTGIGVPQQCVSLVFGSDSSNASKANDCCTECHAAGLQSHVAPEKSPVVIGSCLACHTR